MKRFEKIAYLKKKWENKEKEEIETTKTTEDESKWTVWRKRKHDSEPKPETENEKEENLTPIVEYSIENLIRKPKVQPATETIPEFEIIEDNAFPTEIELEEILSKKSVDADAITEPKITKNKKTSTPILVPPKF